MVKGPGWSTARVPGPGDQQAAGVLQDRFDGAVGLAAIGGGGDLTGALPDQRGEHRGVYPVQRGVRQAEQDVVLGDPLAATTALHDLELRGAVTGEAQQRQVASR